MKTKEREKKDRIDLIIKIVLIVIIILLLIHNCALIRNSKYQNNKVPNGNVDIIDIKCNNNQCQPVPTPTSSNTKKNTPKPQVIQGLSFADSSISIKKGDSLKLIVLVNPVELSSAKLTWKSSDSSLVSVDSNGKVKGIKEGTATITVTSSNGKTASIKVTVVNDEVDAEKIMLSVGNKTIYVGDLTQITAAIEPENATNRELTWTSSDSSIASVDNNGIVKGLKAGTVTIIVKTKDGKVSETITITVENVPTPTPITPIPTPQVIQSLSFADDSVSVKKGDSLKLIVSVNPVELSTEKLTWKSSDSNIVSVDSSGKIKGLKEGTATITVTSSNGKTASIKVTVTTDEVDVERILLSGNKTINVGDLTQIIASIEPENATNRELIWTSSDSSIASVDSNGIVTGLKAGTVTITVKTKDGKVSETITITVKNVPTPTPEVDNDDGSDTFKVYDREKTPVTWNGATDLKIFTNSIYELDGVIAPESSNTYQFVVRNSTEYTVRYDIVFVESNEHHINMKYKLKKNDTYIIDYYAPYDELNLYNQVLSSNTKDIYYLEWIWESTDNDTVISQEAASYGLQINVEAESINE